MLTSGSVNGLLWMLRRVKSPMLAKQRKGSWAPQQSGAMDLVLQSKGASSVSCISAPFWGKGCVFKETHEPAAANRIINSPLRPAPRKQRMEVYKLGKDQAPQDHSKKFAREFSECTSSSRWKGIGIQAVQKQPNYIMVPLQGKLQMWKQARLWIPWASSPCHFPCRFWTEKILRPAQDQNCQRSQNSNSHSSSNPCSSLRISCTSLQHACATTYLAAWKEHRIQNMRLELSWTP